MKKLSEVEPFSDADMVGLLISVLHCETLQLKEVLTHGGFCRNTIKAAGRYFSALARVRYRILVRIGEGERLKESLERIAVSGITNIVADAEDILEEYQRLFNEGHLKYRYEVYGERLERNLKDVTNSD